jgi:hypothetical protein
VIPALARHSPGLVVVLPPGLMIGLAPNLVLGLAFGLFMVATSPWPGISWPARS